MPKFRVYTFKSALIVLFILVLGCPCVFGSSSSKAEEHAQQQQIKESIVKIYTVVNKPDYYQPWRMLNATSVSGSGCIISGNRILTNAHVVADNTFIQVRRYGEARRYRAHVLWVSHQIDLALLTVDNLDFFINTEPLEIGDLPDTQQEVRVYGFPIGGDTLSITQGILSRIEHQFYTHSTAYHLAGQIDAAINPGNSGGPVIVDDKVVGVAMQAYGANYSENIGYMVPSPIIQHFLKDIEDNRLDGFPYIGIGTQRLENPGLKKRSNLPENLTGILINYIYLDSKTIDLHVGDIILAIDGHAIEDDGTVEFRPKERTWFTYYLDLHQMNEWVSLKIFREGEIKTISIHADHSINEYLLVPMEQYDKMPRYFIYGGIVMSPLSKDLIKQWGKNWRKVAPVHFISQMSNRPDTSRTEIVVVLQVLAADINIGYHDLRNWIVDEINGKKIKDFDDAVNTILSATTPYITLKDAKGYELVIDRNQANADNQKILNNYHIKSDRWLAH